MHGFTRFARRVGVLCGRPGAFFGALLLVAAWLASGPLFHYSDTWQLVINTGTTIVTFLMVFLIQHTQNRDTEALQLKLDELIRALAGAENSMLNIEQLDQEQLDTLRRRYEHLASRAREHQEKARKPGGPRPSARV